MAKQDDEFKIKILETIENELTIKSVCKKLGLSRQSIYRWMKDDKKFAHDVKEATKTAVLELNDECENRVITKIRNDDTGMIKFWLRYRHPDYKQSYIVTK